MPYPPTCLGNFDVPAACGVCEVCITCQECVACLGNNCPTAQCPRHNQCGGCVTCNTSCDTCQAMCEIQSQVFASDCNNAFPSDRWINVQFNDSIIKLMPQGKFYWAWEWIRSAAQYGAERPSSTNPRPVPQPLKTHLRAAHWNDINNALAVLKTGAQIETVQGGPSGTKVSASRTRTVGNVMATLRVNKMACQLQNARCITCMYNSQCCLTCQAECMACDTFCAVTCAHYGCQDCMTCDHCVVCVNCAVCQGCVACQQSCVTCNHNCVNEQVQ